MLSLVVFVLVTFGAAFTGARFSPDAWYRDLAKPSWNPPSWVFAPVWTLLYLGIAVAGWLVWRDAGGAWTPALTLWVAQLAGNALWSWLFFGRHKIAAALVDVSAMWVLIAAFIAVTFDTTRTAAWLFVPYLAWVSFAAILNAKILALNRHEK
jgi:benzodiazapine receptor